jgi:hypothetical protein
LISIMRFQQKFFLGKIKLSDSVKN